MKKAFLTFCLAGLITVAKSQSCEGPVLLSESFENGTIPASWTVLNLDTNSVFWTLTTKGFTGSFQPYFHNGERCVANVSQFNTPDTANDWLISPAVTLGSAPVCLSWKAGSQYSFYPEAYEVLISTTTPTVPAFKAHPALYTQSSEPIRWNEHSVDLSAYAGQTVYIAFHYNSYQEWTFFLDDIRISSPVNLDSRVTSLVLPPIGTPSATYTLTGQTLNGGLTTITSMDLNWSVNGGTVHAMPLTNCNIAPSAYYNYAHTATWAPSASGTYTLAVWASNINGQADQYHANDTLRQVVFIHTQPRVSLVEEFTNTDCAPCAQQNPAFDQLLEANRLTGKVSMIKYHAPWPGAYDPMYLADKPESRARVFYFGQSGLPGAFVDGVLIPDHCGMYDGAPACLTQGEIDSAQATPSIFQMQVNTLQTGAMLSTTVTVTALTDVPLNTLHLRTVVIEDTVTYAVAPGTNGETLFGQVMRKMLPDEDGVALNSMTQNQSVANSFSWNVDTACNPAQLRIVAFVQDDNTQYIYQSMMTQFANPVAIKENAVKEDFTIYPNPASSFLHVQSSGISKRQVSLAIKNSLGQVMSSEKIEATGNRVNTRLDLSNLAPGVYFIEIVSEKGSTVKKFIRN